MEIKKLIIQALKARQNAYAPYSGFKVGAALLAKSGAVYCGCNIENAAYSPSNCAERTAFFKAVSEGVTDFVAIAIVGGKSDMPDNLCAPCGVCRQVMLEFCNYNEFDIILAKSIEEYEVIKLNDLMPYCFSADDLDS